MAVDQTALAGPDLWIDPRVRDAFFRATGSSRRSMQPGWRAISGSFDAASLIRRNMP